MAPGRPISAYLGTPRPWLSLYNVRVKQKATGAGAEGEQEVELAPVQHLPDELLMLVLSKLSPYQLGLLACTCRHFRAIAEHPRLWEAACHEAMGCSYTDRAALHRLTISQYRGSWRRLFLEHPHLRFDGIYVSRNTYVRTGAAEWSRRSAPVHLVTWFRYFRFFPNGTLLYRTSPSTVSKVAKSLRAGPLQDGSPHPHGPSRDEHVQWGRFIVRGSKVYAIFVYPNSRSTEIRAWLNIRSTVPGANNRLDIQSIVSFDLEMGTETAIAGAAEPGAPDDDPGADNPALAGQRREHRRGLTPCVLVTWEQIHTSVLNLPSSQMDIFIPG